MPIWDNVFQLMMIKIVYVLCASTVLWGLRLLISRPVIAHYYERRWRCNFFFKALNWLIIMGYLWVILNGSIWVGLRPAMQMFSFLVIDDCWNLLLLIGYILWFMWQSYQLNRQAGISFRGFGSYLMQYGYAWLFTLNIVSYMRIDYYYLPLITRHFHEFNRSIVEMITFLVFLLLQLGVLYVRQLRMVEAGPELRAMVAEVAACFKLKIKNVRVWKLDRINNAFSTGLFFRGIFLTETLVNSASLEDLKMILGHECAHFKCHHLEIRILVIGALIYLGSTLMEDYPDLNGLFYFGFALAAILIYQAIARRQELKADRLAAKMLGGKDKMADALTRVLGLNVSPSKFGWLMGLLLGHPDLETRVKWLQK